MVLARRVADVESQSSGWIAGEVEVGFRSLQLPPEYPRAPYHHLTVALERKKRILRSYSLKLAHMLLHTADGEGEILLWQHDCRPLSPLTPFKRLGGPVVRGRKRKGLLLTVTRSHKSVTKRCRGVCGVGAFLQEIGNAPEMAQPCDINSDGLLSLLM